jgi:hypothetical protein
MKIVETDNHGSDYPKESFVNLGSMPKEAAEEIAETINKHLCPHDSCSRYWKVVKDDYKLQPRFEP